MQFALYRLNPASMSACEYCPSMKATARKYVVIMGRSITPLCLCDLVVKPQRHKDTKPLLDYAFRMATIRFTRNIQRHVECPTREFPGTTLRAVLDAYFRENEKAR